MAGHGRPAQKGHPELAFPPHVGQDVCSGLEVPALHEGDLESMKSTETFHMLARPPWGFKTRFCHFSMPFKTLPEFYGDLGKRLSLIFKDTLREEDGRLSQVEKNSRGTFM